MGLNPRSLLESEIQRNIRLEREVKSFDREGYKKYYGYYPSEYSVRQAVVSGEFGEGLFRAVAVASAISAINDFMAKFEDSRRTIKYVTNDGDVRYNYSQALEDVRKSGFPSFKNKAAEAAFWDPYRKMVKADMLAFKADPTQKGKIPRGKFTHTSPYADPNVIASRAIIYTTIGSILGAGIRDVYNFIKSLFQEREPEEVEQLRKEILDLGDNSYNSLSGMGYSDEVIQDIWDLYSDETGLPQRDVSLFVAKRAIPEDDRTPLEIAKEEYGVTELKAEAVEDWLNNYEMLLKAGHTPQSAVTQTESIFGWVLPDSMLDPILQQDVLDLEERLQPEDDTLFEMRSGDVMEWIQDAADMYGMETEEHWQEDERLLQEFSAGDGLYPEIYEGYPQEESLDNGDFPEFHPEMNDLEIGKDLENMAYGYRPRRRYRRRTRRTGNRIFKDRQGVWRWSNSGKRVNMRR